MSEQRTTEHLLDARRGTESFHIHNLTRRVCGLAIVFFTSREKLRQRGQMDLSRSP